MEGIPTIEALVLDAYEVDLHRLGLRVAQLEALDRWHRDVARTAVEVIRTLTHCVDRHQDQHRADTLRIQELEQEVREIYQALPTMSNETTVDHDDVRY